MDGLSGLEEVFGDYPWQDLVLAEIGSRGGFSMEYPRMIHLTRDKVADPYVVYHEVAHQWFYGQLGSDQQAEPWLDEAFADFSARYLMGIAENACSTRPVDSEVFAWEAGETTGGDWTSCDGNFHALFYQGTEFLNAVRAAMGEEAFFGAMRGGRRASLRLRHRTRPAPSPAPQHRCGPAADLRALPGALGSAALPVGRRYALSGPALHRRSGGATVSRSRAARPHG